MSRRKRIPKHAPTCGLALAALLLGVGPGRTAAAHPHRRRDIERRVAPLFVGGDAAPTQRPPSPLERRFGRLFDQLPEGDPAPSPSCNVPPHPRLEPSPADLPRRLRRSEVPPQPATEVPSGPELSELSRAPRRTEIAPKPGSAPRSRAPASARAALAPVERRVVELLAAARSAAGLAPLRIDPIAVRVARAYSRAMCKQRFFAHHAPDGSQPWDRLRRGGARFRAAGENIAVGYDSAASVHRGWMKSPGHRRNRMSSRYGRVGVGMYRCGDTLYWTELFMD